jgi:hypothetical protein
MTVEVTTGPQGLVASVNGGATRPLLWQDGWTFKVGETTAIFERRGATSGPAALLRWDGGGGYFVLRRE